MIKKYISIILSILLCVSIFQVGYAEDSIAEPSENENTIAEQFAKAIGAIAEECNFDSAATIEDLAKMINIVEPTGALSDKYFNNAYYTKELRRVTAVAVMLDVLGYSVMFKDGFIDPEDMVEIGRVGLDADIMDNVGFEMKSVISMGELVNLFWNTMRADAMEGIYTSNSVKVIRRHGIPFMETALNMFVIQGVVKSTKYSSIIDVDVNTSLDLIQIGSEKYNCDEIISDEFLGKNVIAVIKRDRNDVRGKLITLVERNNQVIIVDAEQLNTENITKDKISFYKTNNKTKQVNVDKNVDVLYNYQLKNNFTADDFKITTGRLVLIDNDTDSNVDVVKIESYISFDVYRASEVREGICDKDGNTFSIEKMVDDGYPIISEGNPIDIQNITQGSVATCFLNEDGEVMRMYINNDTISGKVYSIDKSERIITIEDTKYTYSRDVASELAEKVAPGWEITAKLNYFGEVSSYTITAQSSMYGYLLAVGEGTFDERILYVYTELGEFKEYVLKSNLVVNGTKTTATAALDKSNYSVGFYDEIGFIKQLIRFRVNSEDVITAVSTTSQYNNDLEERVVKYKEGRSVYRASSKEIYSDVRLNNTTKVFTIPNSYSVADKEFFKAGDHNTLLTNTAHTVAVYDVDEDQYAGAVVKVVEPNEDVIIDNCRGDAYLVQQTMQVLGKDDARSTGLIVHKIGGGPDAVEKLIFRDNMVTGNYNLRPTDIKEGDIIQVGMSNNMVVLFQMMYQRGVSDPTEKYYHVWASSDGYQTISTESFYSDGSIYANGVVKQLIKEGFIANFRNRNDFSDDESWSLWDRVVSTDRALPVYIYEDTGRNISIRQGYIGDLTAGDRVFVMFRKMEVTEIIIYR